MQSQTREAQSCHEFSAETDSYYYRARYYDTASGRFLSEDPVGFGAEPNFYPYVRNFPTNLIDPTGLQGALRRPDPRKNTIICDGKGGIIPQIGFREDLGGPKDQKCLMDCAVAHEMNHRKFMLEKVNPNVCKQAARGWIPTFDGFLPASEVDADNAELACLRDKLTKPCNKDCALPIIRRITEVEATRASYAKQLQQTK